MRRVVRNIASNPLISGSFFVFSGGMLANFLNFIFNVGMSRNLTVSEYGNLISLVSIIMLASIPAGSIVPTIVSVAGTYFAKEENAHLKTFFIKIFKPLLVVGLLFIVMFVVFAKPLGEFLKISNFGFMFLTSIAIFFAYIGTLSNAFLQAKLSFKLISLSNVIGALFKVVLGFALVFVGFGEAGPLFAFTLSLLIPIIISTIAIRKILFAKFEEIPKISYKSLITFGIPSSIAIFSLSSLISTDIILVKHLYTPEKAGLYAGLSLIGKVIYYLTAPIGMVMFPTIIHKFNKQEKYNNIIILAVLLVFFVSISITAFYYLFPEFTLRFFLKNEQYLEVAPYVGLFGVFIALYSLVSLFTYYFLSIGVTKIYKVILVSAILQVILIYLFHKDFTQVILASISVSSLLLIVLLLYYFNNQYKKQGL